MSDVVALAGEEVVDADDVMTLLKQEVSQVRTEEAGGAGNQDSH
jgi:hypothetical protein